MNGEVGLFVGKGTTGICGHLGSFEPSLQLNGVVGLGVLNGLNVVGCMHLISFDPGLHIDGMVG